MLAHDCVVSRSGDGMGAKASRKGCEWGILQCDLCSLCFRWLLSICSAKRNPFSQVLPPIKMLSWSWVCGYIFSNIIGTHTLGLFDNSLHLLRSLIALFVLISLLCNGFAFRPAIVARLPAWSRVGHVILYLHYYLSATLNIAPCLLYTRNLQLKFKHKSQTKCVLYAF